jgi:hypothetical protein
MTLGFKRKSKKNKRNRNRNKSMRNSKRCKITRKKRARFTKKNWRKKGGMFSEKRQKISHQPSMVLAPLPNTRQRFIPLDSILHVDGADYELNPLYQSLIDQMKIEPDHTKSERFKEIKEEIDRRAGLLRDENGIFVTHDLPKKNENFNILTDKLLKFVVVYNIETQKHMILWSYATIKNFNYANDFLIKWIDYDSNGRLFIRETPKKVRLLTREIITEIESDPTFSSRLVNRNLLLTKSFNPKTYDEIINEYFSERYNMANTVVVCPIYEMPHSGIANHYTHKDKLLMSAEGIPRAQIFAGLEGVFYHGDPDNTLYFVIGNLSGHYKTPKSLMESVKQILDQYGYIDSRIIEDPLPPSPPSSIDSDDSDAPREEYRRFITNDPRITTFQEALTRLNAADVTPVEVLTSPSFSQEI